MKGGSERLVFILTVLDHAESTERVLVIIFIIVIVTHEEFGWNEVVCFFNHDCPLILI